VHENDQLTKSLDDVLELEQFLHSFIGQLANRPLKAGDDVTRFVEELGLKLPGGLSGAPILWGSREERANTGEQDRGKVLVLARPGIPTALGFTIGCITFRGRRYCLECGWIFCRIVIRF
jgi:hypothetical protein